MWALGEGYRMSGGQAPGSLGPLQEANTHQTACGHGDCQKVLERELWERQSESSVSPALQAPGRAGDPNPHSISVTWVSSARGETSSISRSGRLQQGGWGFWDRFAFWSTCEENWGTNCRLPWKCLLSWNRTTALTPGLTVQAVFQKDLLCLKDREMER